VFFSSGGLIHLAVLLSVLFVAAGIGWIARQDILWRRVALALGIGLTLFEIQWYVYCIHQGLVTGLTDLPLHLCDITFWLTVWVLFRPNPPAYDIAYYWALAGTTMALLMPDVKPSGISYPVVHFFVAHGLVVACILGIALGKRLRPQAGAWKKAWVYLNGYVGLIMVFNFFAKTNYVYVSQKPSQPSLLDYFGPWPWYILPADLLALGLFWLLYQPYRLPRT
jgi:hypothetical integral membrane protein (TIGR02206 family)